MSESDPPLFALPDFAPPSGAQTAWVTAQDGVRLRTAVFPAPGAHGTVVLNTGRTEFIEKYYEVIGELVRRAFTVLTHDWRGQGLSDRLLPKDPLKGHAVGAAPFLSDFAQILAAHADLPQPWVAVGHSMGGALTLLALLRGQSGFSAAVLSSPMVGVNTSPVWPPAAAVLASANAVCGRATALVRPGSDPLQDQFAGNVVTHDEQRWARSLHLMQAHPELALNGATWGWLDFALAAGRELQAGAGRVTTRLCVAAAGAERLADTEATRRFCTAAPQAQFVAIDGAYHELLMETDPVRARFWSLFDACTAPKRPRSS